MKSAPLPEDDDARLDALFQQARTAPLPRAADRLALGFGARMEARARAAAAEAATLSRWVWGWVTGLGACTAVAVALAGFSHNNASASTASVTSFQEAWTDYTAVPEVWPE